LHEAKYIVGIDLGTTHCVLAYSRVDLDADSGPDPHSPVPQIVNAGETQIPPLLPSFLFLPGRMMFRGSLALPWNPEIDFAVGEFARTRGAELPTGWFHPSNHGFATVGWTRRKTSSPGTARRMPGAYLRGRLGALSRSSA
jgi:molecular chaperone DnaK (HSP70)